MNCPEKNVNPGGGGVEVLGVKILWTAEKIDNLVGGARAKLGNQLVIYKINYCYHYMFYYLTSDWEDSWLIMW